MSFWSTLGSVASSVLGIGVPAAASAAGQATQNAWSASQAAKQMDFQERMSSTAHQREVADLKAAGLNPLLSVNAGASSPGGSMGSGESAIGAGVASAMDARRLKKELQVANADIGLKGAQADAAKAQADWTRAGMPQRGVVNDAVTSGRNLVDRFVHRVSEPFVQLRERDQDRRRLQHLKDTEWNARERRSLNSAKAAEARARAKFGHSFHGAPPDGRNDHR